jgi:hypothetical protein
MRALDLQRNDMSKPIIRMAAAAAVAGLIVFATSATPKANVPNLERAPPQSFAKGDRLAVSVRGTACSQRGWPNFEQNCQFDLRRPANAAQTVRVIALR